MTVKPKKIGVRPPIRGYKSIAGRGGGFSSGISGNWYCMSPVTPQAPHAE